MEYTCAGEGSFVFDIAGVETLGLGPLADHESENDLVEGGSLGPEQELPGSLR